MYCRSWWNIRVVYTAMACAALSIGKNSLTHFIFPDHANPIQNVFKTDFSDSTSTQQWCIMDSGSCFWVITYNEKIAVLMSLNRCLITTNLLNALGQLIQNVHISFNNCVIIKQSLTQHCAQAKVSTWLSSAFLERLSKWQFPRWLCSPVIHMGRAAPHMELVVEKELLWQFVCACRAASLNMATTTAGVDLHHSCRRMIGTDGSRSPDVFCVCMWKYWEFTWISY